MPMSKKVSFILQKCIKIPEIEQVFICFGVQLGSVVLPVLADFNAVLCVSCFLFIPLCLAVQI